MLVTSSDSAGCVQKNVRSTFGDSDPLPVVFPCSRARSDETHDEGVVTFEISFLVWFRNWTCAFALIVTIELLLNVPFHSLNESAVAVPAEPPHAPEHASLQEVTQKRWQYVRLWLTAPSAQ